MDYFFSRLGRGFRYTATILGGLSSSAVVVMGFLGVTSIAVPICGCISLIPLAMVMMENVKFVRDMEKHVSNFKKENLKLKQINIELSQTSHELNQTKSDLIEANNKYEKLLDQAEINLDSMKTIVSRYEQTNKSLQSHLTKAEQNNQEIKSHLEEIESIKKEYELENIQLKSTIDSIQSQLDQITSLKDDYELNLKQSKLVTEQLEMELEKTKASYEKSQLALKTLLQTTGVLKDLGEEMIKTEVKTEHNVDKLSNLLELLESDRTKELFEKLDKDGDDKLTLEEFVNLIVEQKSK